MRREQGIALIQVLLVTGIIALLMLQMGLTAREQVARAQALADRAEVQLAAQSRESALLYTLLTEQLVRVPDSENPYVAAWNFHGEPFTVDGITFSDPGRIGAHAGALAALAGLRIDAAQPGSGARSSEGSSAGNS